MGKLQGSILSLRATCTLQSDSPPHQSSLGGPTGPPRRRPLPAALPCARRRRRVGHSRCRAAGRSRTPAVRTRRRQPNKLVGRGRPNNGGLLRVDRSGLAYHRLYHRCHHGHRLLPLRHEACGRHENLALVDCVRASGQRDDDRQPMAIRVRAHARPGRCTGHRGLTSIFTTMS